MSDLPENIDLKFLPDWLKEEEKTGNRYADFEGESERGERRGDRPGRAFAQRREGRGPQGPREQRGPRPGGVPKPQRSPRPGQPDRGPRPDRGPGGPRRDQPFKGGKGDRRPERDDRGGRGPRQGQDRRPPIEQVAPAKVKIEFLPEPAALAAISRQIKSTHRAFPLFGTARLFLERPERHRVRITTLDGSASLFQLGDGPIATDRTLVERDAFRNLREKYYREDVQQNDPPKGNFANVARLRASGLLLGPTNYHSYQPTLRRIYEERYSRRMSFGEFQSREVEVVTDEQTINDWKEQARSVSTWTTLQGDPPQTFKTLAEVEAHFRQHYLPLELKSAASFEANGQLARSAGDRALNAAIREAAEKERGFPANIVNAMRPVLTDDGLHFFKHRKRIVFVSAVRPHRHPEGQPAKENVLAILAAIEASPRCGRHDLAVKLLGENTESPELADKKTALAADLHYLLLAGHVIEFPDGKLDLPLPPKALAAAAENATAEAGEAADDSLAKSEEAPIENAASTEDDAVPTEPPVESTATEAALEASAPAPGPIQAAEPVEPSPATPS